MRRIIILRPEPGASATFAKAAMLGLNPVKLPLFEIERLAWSPPHDASGFDGLLVTSANAIREGGVGLERVTALPVYAVGPVTAEAARNAGFEVTHVGSSNAAALLAEIDPDLRLLHLAGEDRIDQSAARQRITVLPAYRARAVEPIDPAPLVDSVALVHSPRAGRRLADVAPDRSSTSVAAISEAAAQACGEGWRHLAIVAEPRDSALLALAARLCDNESE